MTTQTTPMKTMTYGQAICDGMAVEMRRDPKVYVVGEDVGMFGGGLGVTLGLLEEFGPRRVRDSPLSETAIVGHAVGAAAAGLRPIAEIMFDDFLGIVLDELGNQAAKARYMFGGKMKIPMVLRASCGAGIRAAAQHSQSLEAWCAHVPGLKTVAPSSPADAKGLICAAVRDDNPVVFLEHKLLLGVTGDVPEGEYLVPLGKAEVAREGDDVTLVTWSAMVQQSLKAAELLAAEGVSCEVIDLRTIVPLDTEAILESVAKTHQTRDRARGRKDGGIRSRDRRHGRRRGVRLLGRAHQTSDCARHAGAFQPGLGGRLPPQRRQDQGGRAEPDVNRTPTV